MPELAALVSVDEYLNTSYEGLDREYVDGEVIERPMGETAHSLVQFVLCALLYNAGFRRRAFPEQRIPVSATRYRIPDVCVYREEQTDPIPSVPPFLAVEILSRDDRANNVERKIHEYFAFGIEYVWIIDPVEHQAWVHTPSGSYEAVGVLKTENPAIEINLADLF